jgi:hypothetical protein
VAEEGVVVVVAKAAVEEAVAEEAMETVAEGAGKKGRRGEEGPRAKER